jgi:tetratricopeptide (TPR) repeat protein
MYRLILSRDYFFFSLTVLFFCDGAGFGQSRRLAHELDSLYTDATAHHATGNLDGALTSFERARRIAPFYKDVAERIREITEQHAVNQKRDKLEYYYSEGLAHQRRGNWTQASSAFEAVIKIDAGYRDAARRLAEIAKRLEGQSQEALLSRYYTDGLVAMQRKDFPMAINAFQHVLEIDSRYLDTASRLADAHAALERLVSSEVHERNGPDVEKLYQDGLAALQAGDYVNAFVHFKSIEFIEPGYKDIAEKLAVARRKISERVPRAPGRTLAGDIALAGAVALTIILPVVGVLLGSPAARARLYLLQGDYAKAAKIYERLLEKRPTRLKFYPVLANIYLLEGRTDEQAIKVFKMILQMNLLSHRHDDINAIVAQRYLSEGRKDHDAINVMEDALAVEMRKLEQDARRHSGL